MYKFVIVTVGHTGEPYQLVPVHACIMVGKEVKTKITFFVK